MRVMHVLPGLAEEASGPSYSVVQLCRAQQETGVEVSLSAVDHGPLTAPPPFLRVFPFGRGPRRLAPSPTLRNHLMAEARSGRLDLLHNHSLWTLPNVYPGEVARATGVPLVISPRGTMSSWAMQSGSLLKRVVWPLLQRPALTVARAFHATAEAEAEDIRRLGFRQPIAVIPNGIDLPTLRRRQAAPMKTLLFLGRIHPKKGVEFLLDAWEAVHRDFPTWHLRIVGPDNIGHLAEMQARAARLRLSRLEFAGPLYGEAKWQAYRDADLFVLPSHSENFGMSVAESLAAGTPAIVTTGAPWRGLVEHRAGWWIPIGTAPLADALREALALPDEELADMGLRGRSWMERSFSWRHIGELSRDTYAWLLGQGDRPSCVVTE